MVSDNKHVVNQIVTLSKELLFVLFLLALVLVLKPTKASAATLNVATGNGATNLGDSLCQIEEAITNINDQARTVADCVETGAYGTDDTINLPAGTITGTGSGSGTGIYDKSIKVIGQGRSSSIVSDYAFTLSGSGLASALFKDFKIEDGGYISANDGNYDTSVEDMEFDTDDGSNNANTAIYVEDGNLTIKDSYIHGIYNYGGSIVFSRC